MELIKAVELVVKDTHQSYPEMSPAEAIEHTLYTVDIEDLDDSDQELFWAYELVLATGDGAVFTASEMSVQ